MKLGNAIEEINKCNDKKFEAIGRNGGKCFIKMIGRFDGYIDVIVIEYTTECGEEDIDVLVANDYTMSYDWKEYIEPVTFEEALYECTKYGTKFHNRQYGITLLKNPLGNVVTSCNDNVHNTNGDWYEVKPEPMPF